MIECIKYFWRGLLKFHKPILNTVAILSLLSTFLGCLGFYCIAKMMENGASAYSSPCTVGEFLVICALFFLNPGTLWVTIGAILILVLNVRIRLK